MSQYTKMTYSANLFWDADMVSLDCDANKRHVHAGQQASFDVAPESVWEDASRALA